VRSHQGELRAAATAGGVSVGVLGLAALGLLG
jgi:hypothetical protein